jgi:hypothetical protein
MAKPIMTLEGLDGTVTLFPDRVQIARKGIWNAFKFGFNTQREIPLAAIHEVGFKNSNMFMFGEIDFISGTRAAVMPGKKKPVNPNAVKFKKDKQQQFVALKEKIFELMAQQNNQRRA